MFNILFVEDDADLASLGQDVLESAGYRVSVARDGVEALDVLRSACFDLVITDVEMPRMDGVSLVRALRKEGHSVPVLIVSGAPDRFLSEDLSIGHNGFLAKPYRFDVFLNHIHAQLQRRPMERSCRTSD